ncbi:hypothetical protein CLPU_15c00770 [Gottschalkia purinilytica]|uniref:Uncharacterized protein n=1 Tax=Gottschalkia purinilytica TaxID=1503 RepID=A0A0L0W817_GOTPU|nr:hypothetical protein [Gottschalkia purinilytica]KNF07582.1 hypothetical protein CLPU_15c00770 [Gottschalkia purinilytica]
MYDIDILAQIGNMKDIDYKNALAIASLIEVLVDKEIISRSDVSKKAKILDDMSIREIELMKNR